MDSAADRSLVGSAWGTWIKKLELDTISQLFGGRCCKYFRFFFPSRSNTQDDSDHGRLIWFSGQAVAGTANQRHPTHRFGKSEEPCSFLRLRSKRKGKPATRFKKVNGSRREDVPSTELFIIVHCTKTRAAESGVGAGRSRVFLPESESESETEKFDRLRLRMTWNGDRMGQVFDLPGFADGRCKCHALSQRTGGISGNGWPIIILPLFLLSSGASVCMYCIYLCYHGSVTDDSHTPWLKK